MSEPFRIEEDSLGTMQVPANAYYGAQTQRAVLNFPISGMRPYLEQVRAYVYIKKAAALTHKDLGLLDGGVAEAICQAADEALAGRYGDQFVTDVYQAGAGTSFNMNTNELLANRAIEILGGKRGDFSLVHPNDHVNMGQSTNDTFPTALRLGALLKLPRLMTALDRTIALMDIKAREFSDILKSGRTHLQDAVPMTLGLEFAGYRDTLKKDRVRLLEAERAMQELNIGGTATGSGLNAHEEFVPRVIAHLRTLTRIDLRAAGNLVEIMQSMADPAHFAAALRILALDLNRIANDLRLLASGPTTGLAEITLPAVQPGSSIMPGKVNPSILECLNQICYQVFGCATTVDYCAQAGQLELNVMMPVMAWNIHHSEQILATGLEMFNEKCLAGIGADSERCAAYHERSMGLATALNPVIGYARAAKVVKRAIAENRTIREIVLEEGFMNREEWDHLFDDLKQRV
jgi:fumarate hydratase class II